MIHLPHYIGIQLDDLIKFYWKTEEGNIMSTKKIELRGQSRTQQIHLPRP